MNLRKTLINSTLRKRILSSHTSKNFTIKLKDFAQYNSKSTKPFVLKNFINGQFTTTAKHEEFLDPLKGTKFLEAPLTEKNEMNELIADMNSVPKYGLHNPLLNPERYVLYGNICRKLANALHDEEIFNHFCKLIQRVFPKQDLQCAGETKVLRSFLENYAGDNVRFLAKSFNTPGDHNGQQATGYRWPYGAVAVITPFNFPLEIPVVQSLSALFMGNKVVVKVDSKVALPFQEFLNLMLACGLPEKDLHFVHTNGENMEHLLIQSNLRMTQFTGSSKVANRLSQKLNGKIKMEDAGFDWKILGPDVSNIDVVSSICDQDAYAIAGQKCSAQSILFAHKNWMNEGIVDKLKNLAEARSLKKLTISPIMSWSNTRIQAHIDAVLKIPGAKLLFGGHPIKESHTIPDIYGSYVPTAIYVPIKAFSTKKHFDLLTVELFGPFQVITDYSNVDDVLQIIERMENHLSAAVVSNDTLFLNKVLSKTSDGVTFSGIRARTTGTPQFHWFGPCGDPRGAGIATPEAIKMVWSCHREIIRDVCIEDDFKITQT